MSVAVLFCRSDSVYRTIAGCSVWDQTRDARLYLGNHPVVAHPPCRGWGRLRGLAKPRPDEKDLARFAVWQVRQNGGALEHPEASSLWADMGLPRPGKGRDRWGGWSISIDQFWWGHACRKRTWLYICGIAPRSIQVIPLVMGAAPKAIQSISKADRERTPPDFAQWLVELARSTAAPKGENHT